MSTRRHQRATGGIPVVAALLGITTLAACGTGPGADEAMRTAESFAAQASSAPDRACRLLSEQARTTLEKDESKPCAQALPDVGLPSPSRGTQVDVYEKQARVVLAGDVVFVARFADGWKVTAAGCTPQPDDAPYDCEIGG